MDSDSSHGFEVLALQLIYSPLRMLSAYRTEACRQTTPDIEAKIADLHHESQNVQVAVWEEGLYLLGASPILRSQQFTLERADELQGATAAKLRSTSCDGRHWS